MSDIEKLRNQVSELQERAMYSGGSDERLRREVTDLRQLVADLEKRVKFLEQLEEERGDRLTLKPRDPDEWEEQ